MLIANHITLLSSEADAVNLTKTDVKNCRALAKNKNMFELLSKSLAPSIHGHEYVKKAILCMLLGGIEKILPNGTRLRGWVQLFLPITTNEYFAVLRDIRVMNLRSRFVF